MVHQSQKFFHSGLNFALKEIGSVGGVINEAHHVEIHGEDSIWRAKSSAVSFESMTIKESA